MTHEHPVHPTRADVLAAVASVMVQASEEPLPLRLCRLVASTAGADGGAMSLGTGTSSHLLLAATDETAARLDDLQEILRSGPGPHAFREGVDASLDTTQPPPQWVQTATVLAQGVGECTVHAIPLRAEDQQVIGAVTCYCRPAGSLPAAARLTEHLTEAVGAVLSSAGSVGDVVTEESWDTRDRVHLATGLVMEQLGVGPDDGYALLRGHSFAQDQPLNATTEQVLGGSLVFTDTD